MSDTSMALLGANNAQTERAMETLKTTSNAKNLKQIEDASVDFEAVFLSEMMKPMFETVGVDDMFGGGKGEEVFRSFLTQEYGKILASTGTIGISKDVKSALLDIQAAQESRTGTSFAMSEIPKNLEE